MSHSVLVSDEQPVDPDDELLVAYLDGELNDDERKAVEKRLVRETDFQRRLQTLQTGWEWLDDLPDESTNEKLVESTIELVVTDIAPAPPETVPFRQRHGKSVALISTCLLATILGVAGTLIAIGMRRASDLRELEIAENHQAYLLGPEFTFFRELAYDRQWQAMISAMEQVGGRAMSPDSIIAEIPIAERQEVIKDLPTTVRESLEGRWEAYNGFDQDTKEQIRRTAEQVEKEQDGELLLSTMKAASVWLESLSDSLRDRLQDDDPDVRRAALDDAIEISMAELASNSGKLISDETSDRIYLWMQLLLSTRLDESPEIRDRIEQGVANSLQPDRAREWTNYIAMRAIIDDFNWRPRGGPGGIGGRFPGAGNSPGGPRGGRPGEPREGGGRKPGGPGGGPGGGLGGGPGGGPSFRLDSVSPQEFDDLRAVLGDDARQDLESLTSLSSEFTGDLLVSDTLRIWAREAIKRNAPTLDSNEMTRLDQYRERKDRDSLDLRDPEQIVEELYQQPDLFRPPPGRPR